MKRALITGGQQGIGLGIAEALHTAGWQVALAAEVVPDSEVVQAALAAMPGATYHRHDLADVSSVAALMDAVGPVTTLVSNAGVPAMVRGDLLDMSVESFDRCISVNLRGAMFLAQEAARRMLALPADPYRAICFITSVSASMVSPDRAEYCISKSGAAMMAQAFAARLAPDGIGVFDIRPGIIATPMTAPVRDRYDARIADGLVPARRWGRPADIAQTIVPLVRGDFAFATGTVIPVDGGLSIHRL
ncbi:3-ketoacyl-ACP reductase [Roseicyclus mahoneyensis]|uniref:NAD(P)-dependent dehydrogenase (Short-subunit alcohol dehydrogenase family) n=1 Tax=Roseicyclus mahoneyensis TaxID=164332 RepID=A0A316GKX6_9RHOB|nr:3-ketoacyl-ACP reductase [Roseicyclus mahoneyensis]PWK61705.1 NAD(P)-dependent dehydrogenase (short-subunit alcohol dehydrogenase family) [Roseicyclus mahoneyensis]